LRELREPGELQDLRLRAADHTPAAGA
jgi:hypothetical protein